MHGKMLVFSVLLSLVFVFVMFAEDIEASPNNPSEKPKSLTAVVKDAEDNHDEIQFYYRMKANQPNQPAWIFYRKRRLKAHSLNRGMKDGVAR